MKKKEAEAIEIAFSSLTTIFYIFHIFSLFFFNFIFFLTGVIGAHTPKLNTNLVSTHHFTVSFYFPLYSYPTIQAYHIASACVSEVFLLSSDLNNAIR